MEDSRWLKWFTTTRMENCFSVAFGDGEFGIYLPSK